MYWVHKINSGTFNVSRNVKQPTCRNIVCRYKRKTVKNFLKEYPQRKDSRGKYNICSIMEELLEKNCEVQKLMKFYKETKFLTHRKNIENMIVKQRMLEKAVSYS